VVDVVAVDSGSSGNRPGDDERSDLGVSIVTGDVASSGSVPSTAEVAGPLVAVARPGVGAAGPVDVARDPTVSLSSTPR
jgi:hypothetical protein